jgi:hypothetical protein
MGHYTFTEKNVATTFVVQNVAPSGKTIRIFNLSIGNRQTYDLLAIPEISESDIRHSLLKGELKRKAVAGEIRVIESTIDLYQYDNEQREFLESIGVSAVLWDDLRTPLTSGKFAGVKDPSFIPFLGSVRAYSFADQALAVNEEEGFFIMQIPHTYKEGSIIIPHLHWAPSTTDIGVTRWGLEYTWQNVHEVFASPTTIYAESETNGLAHEQLIASFPSIDGTGKLISSMMVCRLFRNSSHANNTYGAGAFGLELDIHFQKNTDGSDRAFIKTN